MRLPDVEPSGRVLTDSEIRALLKEMSPHIRRAVIFALHTGVRISELLSIHWTSVSTGKIWRVRVESSVRRGDPGTFRPKNRFDRVLALSPIGKSILGHPRASGRVFELTKSQLEQAFRKAVRKAGLGRVRFHDLRHTYFTRLAEASGGDAYLIMEAGGWRTQSACSRYIHLGRGVTDKMASIRVYPRHSGQSG